MNSEIPQPLPPLTTEDRAVVFHLSEEQRRAIDESLVEGVMERWRKVAMIIARAMDQPSYGSWPFGHVLWPTHVCVGGGGPR